MNKPAQSAFRLGAFQIDAPYSVWRGRQPGRGRCWRPRQ